MAASDAGSRRTGTGISVAYPEGNAHYVGHASALVACDRSEPVARQPRDLGARTHHTRRHCRHVPQEI